ncbi:hypothetical protein DFJ64_1781 [Thermasporomyces composti]|uniref:Uncharacterized protein n=1 Tax=Thermasporomyces composti TaxID=696763 RepID=A0A3D9VE10_THECX|nr:hypothetical protein DFJ64_1781 [Thermasporomyces composti]
MLVVDGATRPRTALPSGRDDADVPNGTEGMGGATVPPTSGVRRKASRWWPTMPATTSRSDARLTYSRSTTSRVELLGTANAHARGTPARQPRMVMSAV